MRDAQVLNCMTSPFQESRFLDVLVLITHLLGSAASCGILNRAFWMREAIGLGICGGAFCKGVVGIGPAGKRC